MAWTGRPRAHEIGSRHEDLEGSVGKVQFSATSDLECLGVGAFQRETILLLMILYILIYLCLHTFTHPTIYFHIHPSIHPHAHIPTLSNSEVQ